MKFIVPANNETKTIDYNIRFMLSDNNIFPKTYEISKVLDTFPIGTIQCTLAQCHYNQHTDLCRVVNVEEEECSPINDGKMHRVCDFYKSSIRPDKDSNGMWTLTNSSEELYVHGYPQVITAVPKDKDTTVSYNWKIFIDNEDIISELDDEYVDVTPDEPDTFIGNYLKYKNGESESYYLQDYFDISIDDKNNTFTIAAINKDMVNYIIKIAIYDENNNIFDSVEMEVVV